MLCLLLISINNIINANLCLSVITAFIIAARIYNFLRNDYINLSKIIGLLKIKIKFGKHKFEIVKEVIDFSNKNIDGFEDWFRIMISGYIKNYDSEKVLKKSFLTFVFTP